MTALKNDDLPWVVRGFGSRLRRRVDTRKPLHRLILYQILRQPKGVDTVGLSPLTAKGADLTSRKSCTGHIPSHAPVLNMDVAVAVSGYVSKIAALGDGAAGSSAKMKILLLDSETVGLPTKLPLALR